MSVYNNDIKHSLWSCVIIIENRTRRFKITLITDQTNIVPHIAKRITQLWTFIGMNQPICYAEFVTCLFNSVIIQLLEPQGQRTNLRICAPSEDSDQPTHPRSLIRVFVVSMKKLVFLAQYDDRNTHEKCFANDLSQISKANAFKQKINIDIVWC